MKMQIFTLEVWGLQRSSAPAHGEQGRAGGDGSGERPPPQGACVLEESQPLTHDFRLPDPALQNDFLCSPGTGLSSDCIEIPSRGSGPALLPGMVPTWVRCDA